jgi:SpoVK/Ycf46/Vps4 family AAA+-type ATPase
MPLRYVSPLLFLNALDGLVEPTAPTLWIATSNDPGRIEANLLNRTGRFDRVFDFPLPGAAERVALLVAGLPHGPTPPYLPGLCHFR